MAGVIAVALTDLVRIWSDWLEIRLLDRILADEADFEALLDLDANDDRQVAVGAIHLLVYIGAAVVFIRWFHAAYSNLPGLGVTSLRFKRGWAIGAWFVPILNLWRPKQIANDVWRAGNPDLARANVVSLSEQPTTLLLDVWWGAWLIAGFLDNIVNRALWNGDTLESLQSAARFDIAAAGVEIVAGVLAVLVIRRTTIRVTARRAQVAGTEVQPATIAAT